MLSDVRVLTNTSAHFKKRSTKSQSVQFKPKIVICKKRLFSHEAVKNDAIEKKESW